MANPKDSSLAEKTVLVTGSSSGIGREIAFGFAQEGARLVLTYNKGKKAGKETAEKCRELGASETFLLRLDVASDKSIRGCVKSAVKRFGKIDILVNNAGVLARHGNSMWVPFGEQTFKEIELQCRVNLEGLMKMTSACIPHVKEMIINISSGAGKTPYAELVPYCATKYGVRGFSQSLALGFPKLKVYCVNPGTTKTRMTNFEGTPPRKVAEVVLNTAKGNYKVPSGGDVDVWEILKAVPRPQGFFDNWNKK
ncbi:MAG: SDR family oxidoreductase [archaeon]